MLNKMMVNFKLRFVLCVIVGVLTQLLVSDAVNFNLKTHICCNGTVAERGESTNCCGSEAFDGSEAVCCGDKVISYRSSPEDRLHHGCCYSSKGTAKPLDTRTHQCCDGEPLAKPDPAATYGCCSGKLFNATSHVCCNEKLLERTSGDDCCGDRAYNGSRQVCCQKWALKGDNLELEYSDLLDRKGAESFCCGRAVYDAAEEVCCNDKILPKPAGVATNDAGCCEGRPMDHGSQLCCRGNSSETLRNKTGSGSSCCGLELYDFHEEVCCNEKRQPKPEGMDKETLGACCGDQVMTSFEFQLCDNNKLVKRGGFNMWTCGTDGVLFNTTTHHCCFGEVLENEGDQSCCYLSSKPYNKKKENCCGDEIVTLSEEDISGQKFQCCAPAPHFNHIDHIVTSKP